MQSKNKTMNDRLEFLRIVSGYLFFSQASSNKFAVDWWWICTGEKNALVVNGLQVPDSPNSHRLDSQPSDLSSGVRYLSDAYLSRIYPCAFSDRTGFQDSRTALMHVCVCNQFALLIRSCCHRKLTEHRIPMELPSKTRIGYWVKAVHQA